MTSRKDRSGDPTQGTPRIKSACNRNINTLVSILLLYSYHILGVP